MKKSLVMASLVVASTSLMAMDLQYFLGAGVERIDADTTYSVTSPIQERGEDSFRDTGLLLKAGVILDKTHRISLSHTKFSKDDVDVTTILGNYDYLIPMNEEFRLYAGVHAGNTEIEVNDVISYDYSGLSYGVQVGAIYDITKNIEFELGLAYTKFNVDTKINEVYNGVTISGTEEVDNATSMFAGINYKF